MEPNQEPFVLNCLKEEAKEDLSDCIKLYLKNKSLSLSSNVKIGNNDGDGDFTPWWIEFSKRSSNQTQLNTNAPSTSKSGKSFIFVLLDFFYQYCSVPELKMWGR